MKKLILGLLFICSVNLLEASSSKEVAIGYNPADFALIFNGKPASGGGLAAMINTILFNSNCLNDSSKSYDLVESENPRMMEIFMKEINFSHSKYADPSSRLTSNIIVATHLLKGSAIIEQGIVSINLRIEDRQGCVKAHAKLSGPEKSFFKLIDEAAISLAQQMCNPDPNEETCTKPYYTVTTSQKTTRTVKPIENYRGINKDLKSYQEDKHTYYIYIDTDKAKIVQYHVHAKSTRKIHRETYKLNMDSCQYEIKKEDKLIKNLGGGYILKSEDAGWGFEDETKLYVDLPSSDKSISFTWGRLKKNNNYSHHSSYKEEIPQIAKNLLGKMNDMATQFRKESKKSEGIEIFKSFYDYPGTPKHVQCGGKVSMESFLIPPLDALTDPSIDFSIKIKLSNKSEMQMLKNKMNIK